MFREKNTPSTRKADVIVERTDLVNRELTAWVDGASIPIYVPPDCEILLRGERIKLRMVQAGDRLRVDFAQMGDFLVAREIEVQLKHACPSRR